MQTKNSCADSERDLLAQACAGRKEAFESLFGCHETSLRRMLTQHLRASGEVEDLLQNVAYKAFVHLREFRREASLRTWLTQIALNEVRQWWRKLAQCRTVSVEDLPPGVLDCLQARLVRPQSGRVGDRFESELQQHLTRLPEPYRRVLLLRFYDEASPEQAAASLQVSLSALKTRQHRAIQMLRRKMQVPAKARTWQRSPKLYES